MERGVNGNDRTTHQMFLKEHIASSISYIDIASTALESQRPNVNVNSGFAFAVLVASIQADFTLILLSQNDKNTGNVAAVVGVITNNYRSALRSGFGCR